MSGQQMTVAQMLAWVQAGGTLLEAGVATAARLKAIIQGLHPGATDAQLDTILREIAGDAARRAALSQAIAQGDGDDGAGHTT